MARNRKSNKSRYVKQSEADSDDDSASSVTEEQREQLLAILREMVAGSRVIPDDISADELKEILRFLAAQLAPFYISSDVTATGITNAYDKTDVGYHTFLRLWQVFGNVLANGSNSDATNVNASFNKTMQNTSAAGVFGAASIIPLALGFLVDLKQLKQNRERNSIPHQQEQLKKAGLPKMEEKEILKEFNSFLKRAKVTPRQTNKAAEDIIDTAIKPNKVSKIIRTINGDELGKNEGKTTKVARKIFAGAKATWGFLTSAALAFWPAWMIAVLIIGIAASYAFPALPIIVAVSFGVTIAIKAGLAYYRKREQKKAKAYAANDADHDNKKTMATEASALKAEVAETARMRSELMQRFHMKMEHKAFKKLFAVKKEEAKRTPQFFHSPYTVTAANKERVITFVKEVARENEMAAPLPKVNVNIPDIQKSNIGKHLLGSKRARGGRIAFTMVNTLIGQYTLSSFILWLIGSTLLAFSPISAGLAAAGALILGAVMPGISAGFSGLIGVIYSSKAFADAKAKQLQFDKALYLRLSEEYKNGQPKHVVFDNLSSDVDDRKKLLRDKLIYAKQQIKEKQKQNKPLTDQDKYILKLDLNKINVYNDRYFRTQEVKPSLTTYMKKGLFRAYKTVNAGQTWIFVTRSLFLVGAALAGLCLLFGPAAGFAFIAIAATMATIGIICKLSQMHMDKKAKDKAFFVETFDARISYLKKKDKQLVDLDKYLDKHYRYSPEDAPIAESTFSKIKKQLLNKSKTNKYQPLNDMEINIELIEKNDPNSTVELEGFNDMLQTKSTVSATKTNMFKPCGLEENKDPLIMPKGISVKT